MKETIKLYQKQSFFSDDFPFAIRHVENRSEDFNLSKRFLRQFWKITLIAEGTGFFVAANRKFPFRKNTLLIVHPRELTTWDIAGDKITLYNILFDRSMIPAELSRMQDPFHLQGIFAPEPDSETAAPWQIMSAGRQICTLIRALHAEFEGNELNREAMLRLGFHQLLLLLIRQSERKYRRHPDWTAHYVQEYIQQHYTSEISLRRIALELRLSPERLCRLYKAYFHRTIREEIHALRVRRACELLRDRTLTVGEVCRLAGFRDLSNFHRIFRSFVKVSPRQYRESL